MAVEVYHVQTTFQTIKHRSTLNFYWNIDNNLSVHPFQVAEELNQCIFSLTNWAFALSGPLSASSWWHRLRTRRVRPTGGPARSVKFTNGSNPGQWPFDVDVLYQSANVKWSFAGDSTGKHQVRLGPIGVGAIQSETWFPLFVAAVDLFIIEHLTPKVLVSGLVAMACINHQTTGGTLIEIGQLQWPPGRQLTRRPNVR
jgi:hypothetical protein